MALITSGCGFVKRPDQTITTPRQVHQGLRPADRGAAGPGHGPTAAAVPMESAYCSCEANTGVPGQLYYGWSCPLNNENGDDFRSRDMFADQVRVPASKCGLSSNHVGPNHLGIVCFAGQVLDTLVIPDRDSDCRCAYSCNQSLWRIPTAAARLTQPLWCRHTNWEIELPNGEYTVTVGYSDPAYPTDTSVCNGPKPPNSGHRLAVAPTPR